jgi:signal transduction histidine kinase
MTHLVDGLLDVSRITTGQVRLQREPVELCSLLTGVIESYRSVFDAARHEVTFSAAATPIYVDGDRIRLTQVFSNILHNAAKYTRPAGRIRIELRHDEGHVITSIRDSGIGIPRECSVMCSSCLRRSIVRTSTPTADWASDSLLPNGSWTCTAAASKPTAQV